MDSAAYSELQNIIVDISYVVNRHCTPAWVLKEAVMNCYNLMAVYDGKALFVCNDREYTATKGDIIFYRPGDMRSGITYADRLMKCFAANFQYTCPVFCGNGWTLSNTRLPIDTFIKLADPYIFHRILELFDDMNAIWLSGKKDVKYRCRIIFTEILYLLFSLNNKSELAPNHSHVHIADRAIKYMSEHYMDNVTLEELAGAAGKSASYFGNVFKRVTGKTPMEYLLDIRMRKAKQLLTDGYSVTRTAEMLGFSDIYYFSKCFKKCEGINPSQYNRDI